MEAAHGGAWLQSAGAMRLAPDAIQLDENHLPLRRPPPRLGEHTDAILAEIGLHADEIADLRGQRVVA
jgi:crotonobetainyl-CoA:carnitine CoA-transferase CaiB-like acyl-CoA transferase